MNKIFIIIFSFFSPLIFAQQSVIDSLIHELDKHTEADTNRVIILKDLCWAYKYIDPDKALEYGEQALSLAKDINYPKGEADAHNNIGVFHLIQGAYDKSLEHHLQALDIRKNINDEKGIASSYSNIGLSYQYKGDFENALVYFFDALKIQEKIKDEAGISRSLNNIGLIYYNQKNYSKAKDSHLEALEIRRKIGDKNGIASSYYNLGLTFFELGSNSQQSYAKSYWKKNNIPEEDRNLEKLIIGPKADAYYDTALFYTKEASKILESLGNKRGIAVALSSIGNIYGSKKNYNKALENYQSAIIIQNEISDKAGMMTSYFNIGLLKRAQNKLSESKKNLEQSLSIAKEIQDKMWIQQSLKELSLTYSEMGNYEKAFKLYQQHTDLKDSIFTEKSSKQLAEMQTKYDTEKKENQIKLLKKEQEIKETRLKRQRAITIAIFAGLVLTIGLAFVILRGYRQKKKANLLLEQKNSEIEKKNVLIEKKNKDITSSIRYALRIQQAILPTDDFVEKITPESFILYKPKDIVSGDFYWLDRKDDTILFSAVDCTGHGVPGAFMSIFGSTYLNQALNERNLLRPADILNFLSINVNNALRKNDTNDDSGVKDGMDLAMCAINLKTMKAEFAGAYNPLFLVRNKEIHQYKADIYPVGTAFNSKFQSYNNIEFDLQKDDILYVFSDGYVDQFGGPKKKKFMKKTFKNLLIEINEKSMDEQKEILEKRFIEWKGDLEQIDDVLVIGVKI